MKPAPTPAVSPFDVIAEIFDEHDGVLRRHAMALLLSKDVARHKTQAATEADDILQEAQLAALRNPEQFIGLATSEARLNKAKTFVWNAVRSKRGAVFAQRRRGHRVSDDWRAETEALSHDEHLALLSAPWEDLPDEVASARQEIIAALHELDRLTITLADKGFEGQELADEISRVIGRRCSYSAATARLSRVRARVLVRLKAIFKA